MHNVVSRGIDRLLRLDYPTGNSEAELRFHAGRTVNALEMIDALEVLRSLFQDTREAIGKPIYRGEVEFDFIHDIKEAIRWYFLVGEDEKTGALNRRKYNSMVMLMLNPIVDHFNRYTHKEALGLCDEKIDEAIQTILDHDTDGDAVDAMIAQRLIQKEVQRRNRVATAVDGIMRLRRRKKTRKKKAA